MVRIPPQLRAALCGKMFLGTLLSATSMFVLLYNLPSGLHGAGTVVILSLAPVCGLCVEAFLPNTVPTRIAIKACREVTEIPARLQRLHVLGKIFLISSGIIICWSFPPLFFAMVVAWAFVVPDPQFRSASYSGLVFAVACLYSPFGWGLSHQPACIVNRLMSFAFFGATSLAGIRAIQSWWQERASLRLPVVVSETAVVVAIAYYGSGSLIAQGTSVLDQRFVHVELISISLTALPLFGTLDYVRQHAVDRKSART